MSDKLVKSASYSPLVGAKRQTVDLDLSSLPAASADPDDQLHALSLSARLPLSPKATSSQHIIRHTQSSFDLGASSRSASQPKYTF
jgi:hypothetical protein